MTKLLEEIMKLSEEERWELIEAIRTSIELEAEDQDFTPKQKEVLKRRLDSYRKNPQNVRTWNEIRSAVEG